MTILPSSFCLNDHDWGLTYIEKAIQIKLWWQSCTRPAALCRRLLYFFFFKYNSLSSSFMILKVLSLKVAVKSLPLFSNEAKLPCRFHSVATIVQSERQWVAKRGGIWPRAFAWLFINDNCQRKEHTHPTGSMHTHACTQSLCLEIGANCLIISTNVIMFLLHRCKLLS